MTKAAETFDLDAHPDDRDVVLKAAMHAYEAVGYNSFVLACACTRRQSLVYILAQLSDRLQAPPGGV